MSRRTRNSHVKKARALLPHERVIGYAAGRSGQNPTLVVLGVLALFAVLAVATYVAIGGVVFPGALLIFGLLHAVCPPRSLVVTDHGVVLTGRSFLNGKPTDPLGGAPFTAVRPIRSQVGQVLVQVGHEQVWLTTKEEAELRQAISAVLAAAAAHPAPTYPPAAVATYPGATYPGATYPGATYPGATYPGMTAPVAPAAEAGWGPAGWPTSPQGR